MANKFYSSDGAAGTSLFRDAHKGVEVMSATAALIKQEQWVEAKLALAELRAIATELAKRVGEKACGVVLTPKPDQG